MKQDLYSHRSNLIVAFHGCDKSVVEKVVLQQDSLLASTNDYDWLGSGMYFWENNETRALHQGIFYPQEIGQEVFESTALLALQESEVIPSHINNSLKHLADSEIVRTFATERIKFEYAHTSRLC